MGEEEVGQQRVVVGGAHVARGVRAAARRARAEHQVVRAAARPHRHPRPARPAARPRALVVHRVHAQLLALARTDAECLQSVLH